MQRNSSKSRENYSRSTMARATRFAAFATLLVVLATASANARELFETHLNAVFTQKGERGRSGSPVPAAGVCFAVFSGYSASASRSRRLAKR